MTDTLTLHRFAPPIDGKYEDATDTLKGAFLDVETTGLEAATDKIIQMAITPFTFTKDGRVCTIGQPYIGYDDPGVPIPTDVVRLTGITDEMVKGQKLSYAKIGEITNDAVIIIAHNAEFDRPFAEKRFPLFEELCWACSMADVPWSEAGYTNSVFVKLEWLAYKHCGMFYDAHRADIDCMLGVHLLSTTLPSGVRVMAALLDRARASYVRLYAANSSFDQKNLLKARGYRWNNGNDGCLKSWWVDIRRADLRSELAWLRDNVPCAPRGTAFDAYKRFSHRVGYITTPLSFPPIEQPVPDEPVAAEEAVPV